MFEHRGITTTIVQNVLWESEIDKETNKNNLTKRCRNMTGLIKLPQFRVESPMGKLESNLSYVSMYVSCDG